MKTADVEENVTYSYKFKGMFCEFKQMTKTQILSWFDRSVFIFYMQSYFINISPAVSYLKLFQI